MRDISGIIQEADFLLSTPVEMWVFENRSRSSLKKSPFKIILILLCGPKAKVTRSKMQYCNEGGNCN